MSRPAKVKTEAGATSVKKNAELTKSRILEAAKQEFMAHGFDGARVDEIAHRAEINKQLIYYYFGNKDNLFTETLKESYKKLRKAENLIKLDKYTAYEAILHLAELNWKFYIKNPELMYLLASENLLQGQHVKAHEKEFFEINQSWLGNMQKILEKGREDKTIRQDLEPVQVNITIAGLVIFSLMHESTLNCTLGINLSSKQYRDKRLEAILEIIGTWIRPT